MESYDVAIGCNRIDRISDGKEEMRIGFNSCSFRDEKMIAR